MVLCMWLGVGCRFLVFSIGSGVCFYWLLMMCIWCGLWLMGWDGLLFLEGVLWEGGLFLCMMFFVVDGGVVDGIGGFCDF